MANIGGHSGFSGLTIIDILQKNSITCKQNAVLIFIDTIIDKYKNPISSSIP